MELASGDTAIQKSTSKMDVLKRVIANLREQLAVLDSLGLSMASMHVNEAIERLEADCRDLSTRLGGNKA